jgi:hypothetical protein
MSLSLLLTSGNTRMDTLMSKDQILNREETQTGVKPVITIKPENRVRDAYLCIYGASPKCLTTEHVQLAEHVWTFHSMVSSFVRIKIWKKAHSRFRTCLNPERVVCVLLIPTVSLTTDRNCPACAQLSCSCFVYPHPSSRKDASFGASIIDAS